MTPFISTNSSISSNIEVTVIDIENLDNEMKEILDNNFVSVCEGNSNEDLQVVKKYVAELFKTKKETWIMGATAEFFIHLYMKLLGFKQECLFLNLEEGSIKKGFDGYYSINGEEWMMESKSGSIATKGISHKNKVMEAMKDISSKVEGKSQNKKKIVNPWRNAYYHASSYDVNSSKTIRENIKKLSTEFINGIYHTIDEFNVIPCGTIFLAGVWNPFIHKEIIEDIKENSKLLKGNKIHVICVTQKSIDLFKDYINGETSNE